MIKHIHIDNFKSIKHMGLSLGKLNLFFGLNGMGKSSTIQSLLLLRQSYWKNNKNEISEMFTNGSLINLGTATDIFCDSAEDNVLTFKITNFDCGSLIYNFIYTRDQYGMVNLKRDLKEDDYHNIIKCGSLYGEKDSSLYQEDFTYIAASHIDPQKKFNLSTWNDNGLNRLGSKGEYSIDFLATNKNVNVPEELRTGNTKLNTLEYQVSEWMKRISPNIRVTTKLEPIEQEVSLGISYDENRMTSPLRSPVNVGFGIPYVMPIVIALLAAKKGQLVLIENPESHLHPKGQTAIAELMAKAANYGVQIICESHSDHIINGVRVAVKENVIDHNDVNVVYFDKNEEFTTKVTVINVDKNGNLDNYPAGLLDEWGDLMARLL